MQQTEIDLPLQSWVVQKWMKLTKPQANIKQAEERRRARLLAGILLFTIVLALLHIATSNIFQDDINFLVLLGNLALPLAFYMLYRLSLTPRFLMAATLFIAIGTVTIFSFVHALASPVLFNYLAVTLVCVTIFYPTRIGLTYVVLVLSSIMIYSVLWPSVLPLKSPNYLDLVEVVSFLLFASGVFILVANLHQGNIRQIQLQDKGLSETIASKDALLDSVPGIIMTTNLHGTIFSITGEIVPAVGPELLGRNLMELALPVNNEIIAESLSSVFSGKSARFELQLDRADLGFEWWECRAAPIYGEQGVHMALINAHNITVRKLTEQRLMESEARFSTIVESTPIPLVITRSDSTILYANEAMCLLTRLTEQQLIGRKSSDFYYSNDVGARMAEMLEKDGYLKDFEVLMKRNDGSKVWVLVSNSMAFLDGEPVLIGGVYDIHERKTMEEMVQESEARFNAIAEATPVPMFMNNMETGEVIFANEAATELFEKTRDDLQTQPSKDYFFDAEERSDYLRRLYHDGKSTNVELRFKKHNGKPLWVVLSSKMIQYGGQQMGLHGVYNIDDRKRMEDRILFQRDYLATLHEVALGLLNRLALSDLLEHILEQVKKMLRVDKGELFLLTEDGEAMEQVVADDMLESNSGRRIERGSGIVGRIWERGETIVVQDYSAWPHRNNDSKYDALHFTVGVPIKLGDQVVGAIDVAVLEPGRVLSLREIALLEQVAQLASVAIDNANLYRDAQRARDQAEAGNRAKSVFLANMSHELRTPLNAILGFARMMTRDHNLTGEQLGYLDVVVKSGEHLLKLINDVLEVSKIEAGKIVLKEHGFDLRELITSLTRMLSLKAEEKDLKLVVQIAEEVPRYITGDEGKLRQVLINLLSNAIKFTDEGSVQLVVDKERQEKVEILSFRVIDTGQGIAEEELSSLFKAFIQTRTGRRSQEGTGLGIPISRRLIKMMGGELKVDSEPGKGSSFSFAIKLKPADPRDVDPQHLEFHTAQLAPDERSRKLLVVEDHPESLHLMVKLLTTLGFEVAQATNGREGVEMVKSWRPELVWMDMSMPVMNGYQAVEEIKREWGEDAPVIVALTASAFEEDRARILEAGCDDFIRKPFQEGELLEALTRHLGVKFTYDHDDSLPEEEFTLDEAAREVVPRSWLNALNRAAILADVESLSDMSEQVRGQHAQLAQALDVLIHDFRFNEIISFSSPN